MSFAGPSIASGGITARRAFEFGRTHVVKPKGNHQATIVWLHGLGDNGASWSQLLETLPLRNVKWICPTAPTQLITLFGGFPSTAWFDVGDLTEDAPDDLEGLDASATHVANLLSNEPADAVEISGRSRGDFGTFKDMKLCSGSRRTSAAQDARRMSERTFSKSVGLARGWI